VKALEFVIKRSSAGLFLAPGKGKTSIILTMLEILIAKKISKNMLVVAKSRIIYNVWPKEIKKWGFDLSHTILHGVQKDKNFQKDVDVYLINYEGLLWLEKKMKGKLKHKFDILVLDESSKIKNTKSKRFKVVRRIAKLFNKRYILTGSPIPNGLKDIFAQIFVLDLGEALGKFKTQFLVEYFYPSGFKGHDWKIIPGADKLIYKKLKGLILRIGKEKDELPPLHIVDKIVPLPVEAQKIYDEFEEEFIVELKQGLVIASNAGVRTQKLRQITSGSVYGEDKKVIEIHNEKIEELEEIIDELQGNPCLVAYEFNHELDRLMKSFPKAKHIGKGVSLKEGIKIEDDWNAGKIPVLFGQISAIAHGLNLQESGHHLVIFSMTWNLEDYEQLIQRLWRQGQKNEVTVIRLLMEDTIDELMVKVIDKKDAVQKDLLNALEEIYGGEMVAKKKDVKMKVNKEVMDAVKEFANKSKISMPIFGKDKFAPQAFCLGVLAILSRSSHSGLQDLIYKLTGKEVLHINELIPLYKKAEKEVLEGMAVEKDDIGNLHPCDVAGLKKYSGSKKDGKIIDPKEYINQPEYMNMNKKTDNSKSKMSSKKKVAPKKKAVTKTATKKKAVTKTATKKEETSTALAYDAKKKVTVGSGVPIMPARKAVLGMIPTGKKGIGYGSLVSKMIEAGTSQKRAENTIRAMAGKKFIVIGG